MAYSILLVSLFIKNLFVFAISIKTYLLLPSLLDVLLVDLLDITCSFVFSN